MKNILTSIALTSIITLSFAQQKIILEPTFSIGHSQIYNSNNFLSSELSLYTGRVSMKAGFEFGYMLHKNIGLETGLNYCGYNQYYQSIGLTINDPTLYIDQDGDTFSYQYVTSWWANQHLSYLGIPIGLRFQIGQNDKFNVSVSTGFQFGMFISGHFISKGDITVCGYYYNGAWAGQTHCSETTYGFGPEDVSGTTQYDDSNIQKMNTSYYLELGFTIPFSESLGISIGPRLDLGITNIFQSDTRYYQLDGSNDWKQPTNTSFFGGKLSLIKRL